MMIIARLESGCRTQRTIWSNSKDILVNLVVAQLSSLRMALKLHFERPFRVVLHIHNNCPCSLQAAGRGDLLPEARQNR